MKKNNFFVFLMTVIFVVTIISSAQAQETRSKNESAISDKNGEISNATGWKNHWFQKNHDKKINCKDCEDWFFCSENEYKSFLTEITKLPFKIKKNSDDMFSKVFTINDSLIFTQRFFLGKGINYYGEKGKSFTTKDDTTMWHSNLTIVINDTTIHGDPLFIDFAIMNDGQTNLFGISYANTPDGFTINNNYDFYYIRTKLLPFFGKKSDYCACNQKLEEKAKIALAKEIEDSKIKANYKEAIIPIENFAIFDDMNFEKAVPVNFKCVVNTKTGRMSPGKGYLYVDTKAQKIRLVGQFTREYKGQMMEVILKINKANIAGDWDIARLYEANMTKRWNKNVFKPFEPESLIITLSDNSMHRIEQCNENAPESFYYSGWVKNEGKKKFDYFIAQYFGN